MVEQQKVDLRVRLGSVELATPIVTASGTSGYGLEYADLADFGALGVFFTKSITLKPREGNPPPRVDRAIDWNVGYGVTAFSLALRDATYIKDFTHHV